MTLRLRYSVRSHVGMVREGNEDSAYAGSRLALVADGMGGHAAGEVASSAVVATLAQLDEDEAGLDLLEVLSSAVQAANDHLRDMVDANSALDGMGTTLTVMLSSGTRLGLAHVGDSRAYLLRDGECSQITHDQTLVQRMVDEGRITLEQAETHPQRSLLTQALDGRAGVQPDLSVREARRGDRYLLCSDGLSGYVAHDVIAETLTIPDADEAAESLIGLALEAGAPDNVTVVIADVVDDSAGLPVTPLVGGAAAEADAVPSATPALVLPGGASLTPEQRAAKRDASGRGRVLSSPPDFPPDTTGDGSGGRSGDASVNTGVFRLPSGLGEPDPELHQTPPTGMAPIVEEPTRRRRRRRGTHQGGRRRWYRRPVPLAVTGLLIIVVAGALITWAVRANSWYVSRDGDNVALYHGLQSKPLGVSLSSVAETGIPFSELTQVDQKTVRGGIIANSHADGICVLERLKNDAEVKANRDAADALDHAGSSASSSPSAKAPETGASSAPAGTASARTSGKRSPTPSPEPSSPPAPLPTVTPVPASCGK